MPYAMNSAMGMGGAEKSFAPDIQVGSQEIAESMVVVFEVK
jgi:hypothetical protein